MSKSKFDLVAHVAAWREKTVQHDSFTQAALDELESHLWEEIDHLMSQGLAEREAFLQACFRLGHEDVLAEEYRKVTYWTDPQRSLWDHFIWIPAMYSNYLKIAFRNLWKQKTYAFINIIGLAVGLAFCALIFLYLR